MQQCTHCQRELANYKQSAMIPHTAEMYYRNEPKKPIPLGVG